MFCPHCGSLNAEDATFCTNCGKPVSGAAQAPQPTPPPTPAGGSQYGGTSYNAPRPQGSDEPLEIWMGAIAFCFPIVGAILYFVWMNEKPKKAKQICMASAIGFGLSVFFYLIMFLIGASGGGGYSY
ncbi:MAG: zinc-ribbon domain-containing protein [Saprospiraceae bacterium]|nr:zinc-ribbon domain-containing protein [Saprospiraceae bacterium]